MVWCWVDTHLRIDLFCVEPFYQTILVDPLDRPATLAWMVQRTPLLGLAVANAAERGVIFFVVRAGPA